MITLLPPPGLAPSNFILKSGSLVRPDQSGAVRVHELDVDELLAAGWRKDPAAEKAARAADNLLRKAADAQARHVDGAGPHPRSVIGEVNAGAHGRVHVEHHAGADAVSVHGVNFALSDVDPDLRAGFRGSAAALDTAQDAEQQTDAKALIGIVTEAILNRHEHIADAVKQRKQHLRYAPV